MLLPCAMLDDIPQVYIAELPSLIGAKVRIHGWLAATRYTKATKFVSVRDRTGLVQGVCHGARWGELAYLNAESALQLIGSVQKCKSNPCQVEVAVEDLQVLAQAEGCTLVLPQPQCAGRRKGALDGRLFGLRLFHRHEQLIEVDLAVAVLRPLGVDPVTFGALVACGHCLLPLGGLATLAGPR